MRFRSVLYPDMYWCGLKITACGELRDMLESENGSLYLTTEKISLKPDTLSVGTATALTTAATC